MPMKTTVKAHKKPRSPAWKVIGAAAVSAAIMTQAHAVGLGQLNVLSALGQPLQAEIELTSVSRDEAGSLAVKLASPEAFRQANIEYNPALQNLRFSVDQRNGRPVVRVTSSQPINEPFVDLLIEVSSRDSRLVREYVVLLDPVGSRRVQSAEATPAPSATAPASQQQRQNRPAASSASSASSAPAAQGGADNYTVKRGDTLASIAGQYRRDNVSLDQMLVAMQRANPNAFVEGNMNRLRSGQILSVPSSDTARAIDTAEARRIVVAQSADFNSYRNRLAGQVAGAAAGQQGESGQIASGRIGARVEEQKNPASESRDKLQVSRSGTAPAAAETEDRIAKDKALAEANSRVAELEKTVNDLQKLLEIRNRDLAARQNSAAAAATPAAGAAPAANAPPAAAPAAAAAGAAAAGAGKEAGAAPEAKSAPAAEAAQASAPAEKPAAADKPKPIVKPAPAPAPEPGFLESLGSNPTALGGGALIVALLAALGVSRSRAKKKKTALAAAEVAQARQNSTLKANSLFGAPGAQNVDTSNSVFNSHFSPSASQLDTNEVDPVAEADVYIAYGRDAQAEEILKEALRNQPDRTAVRAKLLEIYANRKDLRAFETTAAELHAMTKGQGEDWEQAAKLGANLDPSNPLYASGRQSADAAGEGVAAAGIAAAAAAAAAAASAEEKAAPEDEFDLDALLNTTQGPIEPEPEVAAAAEEPPVAEPVAEAQPVSEKPAEPTPSEEPSEEPRAETPAAEAGEGNLLDFDFDLSSFGKEAPAAPESVAAEADDNLMDFDLGQAEETPAAEAKPHAEPKAEEDFPSLDAGLPPAPASAPAPAPQAASHAHTPDPADFDLSGISLDLDSASADPAALDDVPVLGAGSPNAAEMATKLDLASAYQEIGDREGARELLEEVIKGGTADQSEKARAMLEKLA
jgi:pilus assembly protein FimV